MITFFALFSSFLLIAFTVTATIIGLNMAIVRQKNDFEPQKEDMEPSYREYIEAGRTWVKTHSFEEHSISSFDEINLYGRLFRNKDSKTTIIMMHGFRSTAEHDFSLAFEFYFNKGFNLFIPDQRSHGKSEGKYITYGVLESRDLVCWAEYINHIIKDGKLYITGISMGASTVLMATSLQLPENVLGIIADCGFTSPGAIIKKVMKNDLKVPLFPFYYITRGLTKLVAGFDFEEENAVKSVAECKIPILFLHGKDDHFVPFSMGEEIYEAAGCKKQALWVEGADHGCSFAVDKTACSSAINGFLGI